jgi:hypothetical protein
LFCAAAFPAKIVFALGKGETKGRLGEGSIVVL